MSCLFCDIANGTIKGDCVYENDHVIAFHDINPQAPHHVLIIPKPHISTLNDIEEQHLALLGHMSIAAKHIASELNVADSGYRLVMNCNADAGQTVFHIHMHFLAGRQLAWPPG